MRCSECNCSVRITQARRMADGQTATCIAVPAGGCGGHVCPCQCEHSHPRVERLGALPYVLCQCEHSQTSVERLGAIVICFSLSCCTLLLVKKNYFSFLILCDPMVLSTCMYVYVPYACLVPMGTRRGHQITWNWSDLQL